MYPIVLVTGATGSLGPKVAEGLCQSGYSVRAFAKDPPEKGEISSRIDVRIGDITNDNDLRVAIKDVKYVVHMAAMLHISNPTTEQNRQYEYVNVDGTRCIIKHALEEGVERFIFFSTIAVYGNGANSLLNEESAPNPQTIYAQTKRQAEQIVLDTRLPDGRPFGTVLRLAAVYGSKVKGNYRRLLIALASGMFLPIGKGENRRTLVYDKDVAQAVLLVLENPEAAGKIFNVTDGNIYSMNNIIESICDALGRRPPRIRLPIGPMRATAKIIDQAASIIGYRFPAMRNAIDKYTEDTAVDGRNIQKEMGFKPKYDLFSGWREVIEKMRSRREL